MNVIMITGDRSFGPGHPRFELQKSAVENLAVVYMGRGSMWPKIPPGPASAKGGPASGWDVVTAQDPFWRGLFAWRAARKLRARLNIQVHADLGAQPFVKHMLAQIVLRHADSVRVVSERIRLQIANYNLKATPVVLPVFVDVERFRNIVHKPHALARASERKNILWIGRFEDEKDPLGAIAVLKQVHDAGVDAQLVMLGAGSLEPALREASTRLNLGGLVEFPGWQDPRDYLAAADVVLCTSRQESWGASIVEALAAGVQVVAPDVGIAREAGAVVKPRSDLASGVVEALRSGIRGEIKLHVSNKDAWARAWRESL